MQEETTTAMLGLAGFRVRNAEEVDGELVVEMETADPVLACPDCGGLATESRGRRRVKLRDTPSAGRQLRLVWAKRQRRCADRDCERASFVEQHQAVGWRRRTTARCRSWIADQVGPKCRPAQGVAEEVGLGWRSVNSTLAEEAARGGLVDPERPVRALGIDETAARRGHRFVTNLVDLDASVAHDVIPGRSHRVLAEWLSQRSEDWRAGVEVVALDPYAPYRSAVRELLPQAQIVVDKFHGIRLFHRALDSVRRRIIGETHGRRGRKGDALWRARHRLLRGNERLRSEEVPKLLAAFAEDPTGDVEYAYWVKECARWFWSSTSPEQARSRAWLLLKFMADSQIPELESLGGVLDAWMPEIVAYFTTGITNARTEGLNRKVKQVKRAGTGFRNMANYRIRIITHCSDRR